MSLKRDGREAARGGDPAAPPAPELRLEQAAAIANWLAHDFGNVLTGVVGFAELCQGEVSPDSEACSFISEIRHAAARGIQLIDKLLLVGRRTPTDAGVTDLVALLRSELETWRQAIAPACQIDMVTADDMLPVAMGAKSIKQAVEPVLENARDALGGPGRIVVCVQPVMVREEDSARLVGRPKPGAYVELAITDSGVGFGPDARERWLSEPFFSTKPRHHGLGLPMVYGILRSHGGGMCIEDAKPCGTCIRLFLPAPSRIS